MHGDFINIDDELSAMLNEVHRNIGFLEELFKYASNKNVFNELMLLKECTYSLIIDCYGPSFKNVLVTLIPEPQASINVYIEKSKATVAYEFIQ